jgi:cytochrome P450
MMDNILVESIADFDKAIAKGEIDICKAMMRFTFHIAAKSLFSKNITHQEVETLSDSIVAIQQFIVRQIVQPYLNPWFVLSGTLRKYKKRQLEADKIIMAHIQERRQSQEVHNDMLQKLMEAKNKTTGAYMTDEQILMETMQLLVAAHETTANALSWIFYMLTQHPDALLKIKAEILQNRDHQPLQYTDLPKFKYTVQVIEETLRLYPPFWLVDRVALDADVINGYPISKGDTVIPFIYGVHHSNAYWQAPEPKSESAFCAYSVWCRSKDLYWRKLCYDANVIDYQRFS